MAVESEPAGQHKKLLEETCPWSGHREELPNLTEEGSDVSGRPCGLQLQVMVCFKVLLFLLPWVSLLLLD